MQISRATRYARAVAKSRAAGPQVPRPVPITFCIRQVGEIQAADQRTVWTCHWSPEERTRAGVKSMELLAVVITVGWATRRGPRRRTLAVRGAEVRKRNSSARQIWTAR